jgi:hypothetical protein
VDIRRPVGDFKELGDIKSPLVTIDRRGEGIPMSNLSLDIEKCRPLPVVEFGEFS